MPLTLPISTEILRKDSDYGEILPSALISVSCVQTPRSAFVYSLPFSNQSGLTFRLSGFTQKPKGAMKLLL